MSHPFKYQNKDKADLDAGRPLKYHTPSIKKAKSKALKRKINNKPLTDSERDIAEKTEASDRYDRKYY